MVSSALASDRQERLADSLRAAESTGTTIAPPTESDPALTVADAYAIQARNVRQRVDEGSRVVGRKVGLTSAAMQAQLGVDEPDFGVLFDDLIVDDGDAIRMDTLIQPRVEAEIGFVLGRDLGGAGVTTHEALAATAALVPTLEVIDSRVEDWRIGLIDTVADNASCGRVVVGGQLTPPHGLDLTHLGVVLWQNGEVVATGAGAAALGHPAACVAWLARKLAEYDEHLRGGDLVLPGALHAAVEAGPGDVVRAEFAHLGQVSSHFRREGET